MSDEKVKALETAKEGLNTAKANYKSFLEKNKLKDGVTPKDDTLAKKMASHQEKIEKAEKGVKAAKKALKPAKEKKERTSVYEYPDDVVTAEDRKKFRTKARNAAKAAEKAKAKAEKAEAKGEKKKEGKGEKAKAEPEVEKKKKKKEAVSED